MTQSEDLRAQGQRCRDLADAITDAWTREVLLKMAVEYDERAAERDADATE